MCVFGVLLCTVRSYQTGTCFGGAVLCSGVFHDEYSDGSTASGIWLTIRTSSGQSGSYQALDTWWYGTAADLDLSKLGDSTYQGEDEQVLSGLSGDCSANADVGVAASTGAFSVWSGVFGDSLEVTLFMSLGVCCLSRVLTYAGGCQSEGYGGDLRLCATIMGSGRTLVEGLYSEVGCGAAFRVVLCDGAV
mgnify:FL=1